MAAAAPQLPRRRLPIGAEVQPGGSTHFRVWAPRAARVEIELFAPDESRFALQAQAGGYFAGLLPAGVGARYGVRLDGAPPLADPASRYQPEGPEGPSEVIDPRAYPWHDAGWPGLRLEGQVLYELHTGTFTPEGTWDAAARRLPDLAELGVTAVELMPVAEFAGRFGWGYDGVDLYAPTRNYGRPDDLRSFVERAHALGLGVVLDVVYNHLGPVGNVLPRYADHWFSQRTATDWGAAIDYDGPASGPVREFFVANAGYWIDEYHFDGLRFDSTQDVHDASPEHVLAAMAARAREAAGGRGILLFAENEPQDVRLVQDPAQGGYGLDALWNDDFHHSAFVALTGRREGYRRDYAGTARELLAATRGGFLYQGQRHPGQAKPRGTPTRHLLPAQLVHYLENHDQVAVSARGERRRHQGRAGDLRALTALLLLGPATPLLFQGQELDDPPPFLFFAEPGDAALHDAIARGRAKFLSQFETIAGEASRSPLPRPSDPDTFAACKQSVAPADGRGPAWRLLHDLLWLRRTQPAIRAQDRGRLEGAALAERLLLLRFFGDEPADDRLLAVNLGAAHALEPPSEPLLAPPPGSAWRPSWSSDDPRYGGAAGDPTHETERGWRFAAHAAVLLAPAASAT
jgi:maltooligosyltrehalose trehalohydrolase